MQNPDRNAQGNACYGLGRFYYKKYLDDTTAKDAGRNAHEAEVFFARQADKYADVMLLHSAEKKFAFAVVAESRLYELRHLIAGKVAPEITGEDIDGKRTSSPTIAAKSSCSISGDRGAAPAERWSPRKMKW